MNNENFNTFHDEILKHQWRGKAYYFNYILYIYSYTLYIFIHFHLDIFVNFFNNKKMLSR